jgi:hypothetical protein
MATPATETETTAIEPAPKATSKMVASKKKGKADAAIVPTYLSNRPIVPSKVEVLETLADRSPIVKSPYDVKIVHSDRRPIVASRIPVAIDSPLPNNRPIVEYQLEDPFDLMGFLD